MLISPVAVILVWCLLVGQSLQYAVPAVKLEFTSDGYRVSVPDESGVLRVVFKIARKSSAQPEVADVQSSSDGVWAYENTKGAIKNDEILNIKTRVQYGLLNYQRFDEYVTSPTIEATQSGYNRKTCELSETVVRKQRACKGELIFEETFDDATELNATRWQSEIRMPLDVDDAEFVVFNDRPENCFVRNGLLHIVPTLWMNDKPGTDVRAGELDLGTKCTGFLEQECKRQPSGIVQNVLPAVVSVRIRTKDFFSFKYGRVEVRAKLPQGDWLLPLILLEPLAHFYGRNGFASGQLRVAFARGNVYLVNRAGKDIGGSTLYGGAVLARGESLRDLSLWSIKQENHFGQDFHVFSLTWSKKFLKFEVDGKEYGQITTGFREIFEPRVSHATSWRGGELMAPFDQEFYLTLGVSAGGHSDFPDGSDTGNPSQKKRKPWRNTAPKAAFQFWKDRANWKSTWNGEGMQVDYVRVSAL